MKKLESTELHNTINPMWFQAYNETIDINQHDKTCIR